MSDFILETRGLTKEFKGFVAVSNVDLKVQKGHIHALVHDHHVSLSTLLTIVAADPMAIPAADLPKLGTLRTIVAGREVFHD